MEIVLTYDILINRNDIKHLLHEKAEQFVDFLGKMNTEILEITDTRIILYHNNIITEHIPIDSDDYWIFTDNYDGLIATLRKITYRQSAPDIKEPDC